MQKKDHALKTCPCCKRKFHCCEDEGCWCEKLAISRETLALLRTRYVDCVCKECLENACCAQKK